MATRPTAGHLRLHPQQRAQPDGGGHAPNAGAATGSRPSAPGPRRRASVRRRSRSWTEIGIDIRGHVSKTLEPFLGQAFSWLITVCDEAKESCPTIPGAAKAGALEHRGPVGRRGRRGGAPGGVPRGPRHPPRPHPHLHPRRRSRRPPASRAAARRTRTRLIPALADRLEGVSLAVPACPHCATPRSSPSSATDAAGAGTPTRCPRRRCCSSVATPA